LVSVFCGGGILVDSKGREVDEERAIEGEGHDSSSSFVVSFFVSFSFSPSPFSLPLGLFVAQFSLSSLLSSPSSDKNPRTGCRGEKGGAVLSKLSAANLSITTVGLTERRRFFIVVVVNAVVFVELFTTFCFVELLTSASSSESSTVLEKLQSSLFIEEGVLSVVV
jgi:hypothetical protein